MHSFQFDFTSLHLHGAAFFDYLALRKRVFVDRLGWDVPHNGTVEMDQYDTPLAHYSLVKHDGKLVGGARAMSTTANWGEGTYMLRDAYSGKLRNIPTTIMPVEIASPLVWECTRLVISDDLVNAADRSMCLQLIVDGLVEKAKTEGADRLICLSSILLMRALGQLGYRVKRLGEMYRSPEDQRDYAVLEMPAEFSNAHQRAHQRALMAAE